MNRGSQNNHNSIHHQHDQSDLNMQNNNSFQDYLQSSAHNLSFTNLHQNTSFEMEQDNHHHPAHNAPLSPVHRVNNFIPQSFLSKPFEENNYEEVDYKSQQWKFNWTQNHGNNNGNNPISSNAAHIQNFHEPAPTQQNKDSLWDSAYLNENHNNTNNLGNADLELASSSVINNFSGVLNDNGLFSEMKGTPMNRHRSQNPHLRQNSTNENNFGMDMEDDFPNPSRFNQNQMDIENFEQNGTPTLFKKNAAHIVMNYDNYQQSMKASDMLRTPYKNSSSFSNNNHIIDSITNNITGGNGKTFNYLFNNMNDHLANDFKFSPIKSTKNIPFVTPSYFADKVESGFGNFAAGAAAPSDDFPSPRMDEISSNGQANLANVNKQSTSNSQNSVTNPNNPNTSTAQTVSQPCICNCKKTKCLKLYCECFAKLGYCGEGCHCHECKNRPENEDERQNAIQEAKLRNQDAFQPKVANETEQERKNKANNEQLKKGCNCRKTKCLKKYCECFNAGAYCNNMCKCDSCENHPRNAALILQKKNGSCGPQMTSQIIQHHPIETRPPGLVVSQYNQGGYYQNTYNSLHLHQHNQPSSHRGQQDVTNDSHYLNSSALYKSNTLQGRILFEDENEDSDPQNVYSKTNKDSRKYLLNKLRKQKKPIIKNRREGLDNSDEEQDLQSQELSSQQSITLKRPNKSMNPIEQNIMESINEEELQQQKQIEDMEKKLRQIQQVQLLLQQQQILKQEQVKFLNANQSAQKEKYQEETSKGNNSQNSPQQFLDSKLKKQKDELEQNLSSNGWSNEMSQQRFISPPSNNTDNRDEEIDEESLIESRDKGDQESTKAHQILNGIKKNKKKNLKKKEQQLSEEKKQLQKDKTSQNKEKYIAYEDDQESSVSYSNFSTLSQFNQQNIQQQQSQQLNTQFRSRLNSENYEYIRQKSIQYSSQFSLLSANPTKCSTNLFNPTSYSRQNEDIANQNNDFFPYQSQRIKKNSAHIIKAP